MKKLATFVLSTMALSASFSAPASADQYANKGGAGFKVDRSTLQQAEFYNHHVNTKFWTFDRRCEISESPHRV